MTAASKFRDNQSPSLNVNIEEGSYGQFPLIRYRVRSRVANIDVFRRTKGQANQVAALLKQAGFRDVQVDETRT